MTKTKRRYGKPLYAAFLAVVLAGLPAAAQAAVADDCPATCEAARAEVAELVREFKADAGRYTSTAFSEAETRTQFIDRFFEAFGWDVTNRAQAPLYDQDVIPETRLRIGPVMRYADYGFRLDARAIFYVEAKAANQNIDKPKHIFQAKRYAWSSARAELAVLTDFETLRVFDARNLPRIDQPKAGELEQFHMSYAEYVENFPRLWKTFAKPLVAQDSIHTLLGDADSRLERIDVDRAFLADLDRFRLDLGRDLYAANPRLTEKRLNEATHHILNQIVFSRVLEDRDIEPTGRLREAIDIWRGRGAKGRLFDYLKAEFGRLERRYNGVMFGAHFSDGLKVPDKTLAEIVDALYPPTSPYAFDVIPVEVLGRAYEGYLGKRLEIADGGVELALKPEVRKAGGVFYTPQWIVDYILDKTLTPKLRGQPERHQMPAEAEHGERRACSSRAKAQWGPDDWHFPSPTRQKLFDAIMCQNFVLGDIAKVASGLETGADKALIVEKLDEKDGKTFIRSKATGTTHWVETRYLKPIFHGRDVRRYKPLAPQSWLIFPYDSEEYPKPVSKNSLALTGPLTLAYLKAAGHALGQPDHAEIDRLENQIDDLVYALYGVKPEDEESGRSASQTVPTQRQVPNAARSPARSATDLMKLKVLDPACGAGAFTVQMAARILAAATDYYAAHPDKISGHDREFPDAYQLLDGSFKLSARKKAELIENTVFCVDVDPQAIEITKMWLYILILEGEGSPLVTQERTYKIPNRIRPARVYDFKLSDLTGNVVNGNALVANDFSDDPAERTRVRAFDWQVGSSKVAKTVRAGGFDVIVGNPPYISLLDAKKFIPEQHAYIRNTYASMGNGRPDLSYAFMERGLSLLNKGGSLGFITSNGFVWNESGAGLRQLISECGCLKELVDFGVAKTFEDAGPATAITLLRKDKQRSFRHARILAASNPAPTKKVLEAMPNLAFQYFPMSKLKGELWAFPLPEDKAVFEAMERQPLRLGDMANAFGGITTGADGVFVVKVIRRDGAKVLVSSRETGETHWIERKMLRPMVGTGDIRRYKAVTSSSWLIWPYSASFDPIEEATLKTSAPLAYAYLSKNKFKLNARKMENRSPWYRFLRAGSSELVSKPKLLTAWRPGKPQFAMEDDGGLIFAPGGGNLAVVVEDNAISLPSLLGLLNSSSVETYMRTTNPELWAGVRYRPHGVERIPIPSITPDSSPIYAAIAEKVRKILAQGADSHADREAQEKLEAEVDVLVKQLYGVE